MKEWLTAREIAAEKLPDMPATKMGINLHAEREGWNDHPSFTRRRSGRGGGLEYHYRLLPTLAQITYQQRHMRIGGSSAPSLSSSLRCVADGEPSPVLEGQAFEAANDDGLCSVHGAPATGRAALERDARLAIVKQFEQFRAGLTLRQASATQVFCDKYNARSLHIEDWVIAIIPRLSKGSLRRWTAKKRQGVSLAVDRSTSRKGTGVLDTAHDGKVRTFILGLLAAKPHLSAAQIRVQVRAEFGDRLEAVSKGVSKTVAVPPVRSFQHFLKSLKETHRAELLKLTNPDKFRSTMALSGTGALRHVTTANQLWQIDASPVDALCTDGRHSVYACIDIATRRAIFYLSRTPRAEAVGLLIRRAILEWGAPEEIKTDNGSDFVARATQRLFAALDIDMTVSDAYSPEQKGHVERVIRTFQHDLIALVPGYVGHSVADRKAIESRKSFAQRLGEDDASVFDVGLTGAALQGVCDRWAETIYQHRPHAGLKGRTPYEAAAAGSHTVRRVDERALDILLSPVAGKNGLRAATKFGIRIDGHHYLHEDVLPGRTVFVRRDPNDMGIVLVFDPSDGRFLAEAVCAELAGIDPRTWLKAKKELRAEKLRDGLAAIRAEMNRIAKGPALHERALDVAARDVPNVTALPKPSRDHTTPAIAAALDAADKGAKAPAPSRLSGRAAEIHAALTAEGPQDIAAPAPPKVTRLETRQTRFNRARDIEASLAAGEDVSAEDALWLGGYREGPEYRALKAMHEDFEGRMEF